MAKLGIEQHLQLRRVWAPKLSSSPHALRSARTRAADEILGRSPEPAMFAVHRGVEHLVFRSSEQKCATLLRKSRQSSGILHPHAFGSVRDRNQAKLRIYLASDDIATASMRCINRHGWGGPHRWPLGACPCGGLSGRSRRARRCKASAVASPTQERWTVEATYNCLRSSACQLAQQLRCSSCVRPQEPFASEAKIALPSLGVAPCGAPRGWLVEKRFRPRALNLDPRHATSNQPVCDLFGRRAENQKSA